MNIKKICLWSLLLQWFWQQFAELGIDFVLEGNEVYIGSTEDTDVKVAGEAGVLTKLEVNLTTGAATLMAADCTYVTLESVNIEFIDWLQLKRIAHPSGWAIFCINIYNTKKAEPQGSALQNSILN